MEGKIKGLKFPLQGHDHREVVSADVLLYESTLRIGAMLVVDGREWNTRFLRRNLKRRWKFYPNRAARRYTFVLAD